MTISLVELTPTIGVVSVALEEHSLESRIMMMYVV